MFFSEFVSSKSLNNRPCTIIGWGRQCGSTIQKSLLPKTDLNIKEKLELNEYLFPTEYFTTSAKQKSDINTDDWKNNNTSLNSTSDIVETFFTSGVETDCIENHDYMLRYADIPIQNSTECAKDYENANITDIVICAGLRRSKIDSCKVFIYF